MKKTLLATIVASLGATAVAPALAEPAVMVGVSHNFGGATGITVKLLSTNRVDKVAAALGVSYFPGQESKPWGLDSGLGYTFRHGALTVGYDWLNGQVQMGLGVANTKSKVRPVPAPAPAPVVVQSPPPPPAPEPSPTPTPAPAPAPAPVAAPAPAPVAAPAPAPVAATAPAPEPDPCVSLKSLQMGKATAVCAS